MITLFAPFAVFFYIIAGNTAFMGGIIYAILWAVIPGSNPAYAGISLFGILLPVEEGSILYGLHILHPMVLLWVPVYGLFNIIFAIQVIRLIRGKTTINRAILAGLSTLIMPLYEVLIFVPYMVSNGYLDFTGPIPIQLIIGLVIIWKYRPKPLATPWE